MNTVTITIADETAFRPAITVTGFAEYREPETGKLWLVGRRFAYAGDTFVFLGRDQVGGLHARADSNGRLVVFDSAALWTDTNRKPVDYTPGDWAVWQSSTALLEISTDWKPIPLVGRIPIATVDRRLNLRAESNARLLAAAPRLYEACRDVVSYLAAIEARSKQIGEDEAIAGKIAALNAVLAKVETAEIEIIS